MFDFDKASIEEDVHVVAMFNEDCLLNWKQCPLNKEGMHALYLQWHTYEPDQRDDKIRYYFLIRCSGPPAIPNLNPRSTGFWLRSVIGSRHVIQC